MTPFVAGGPHGDPKRADPTDAHAFDFATRYLQALGARTEPVHPTLLRAELSREQYCELTQKPLNTWYIAQTVPEISTLYLVPHGSVDGSDALVDEMPEEAESIGLRSHRLQQMIASALRIGRVSRLRVTPPGTAAGLFRPIALIGFQVAWRCSEVRRYPLPVAIDLVDGTASIQLAHHLLGLELDEKRVPSHQRWKRSLSFRHAFEVACECAKEALYHDPDVWEWYRKAQSRLEREHAQVASYFDALLAESRTAEKSAEIAERRERLLLEVEQRFRPRLELRTELGLLLHCPDGLMPLHEPGPRRALSPGGV